MIIPWTIKMYDNVIQCVYQDVYINTAWYYFFMNIVV